MDDEIFFMPSNSQNDELAIIKKDNRLIEAKYKLGLHEQRLVIAVLAEIRADEPHQRRYKISIADIAKRHGLETGKNLYSQIHEASENLLKTVLDISQGELTRKLTWFSFIEYKKGRGDLVFSFHEELLPYILQLKSEFTTYNLSAVVNFKNSYSIRFYELLKRRQNQSDVFYIQYSIETLKDILGVRKDEYIKTNDFKKRVIEPALKEVNEQTDLEILDVEYIKELRTISEIKITAQIRNQKRLAIIDPVDVPPTNPAYQKLLDFGISEISATRWANKYDEKRINRSLEYTEYQYQQGTVKSKCGYFSKVLADDMGQMWALEQAKKAAEQQARKEKESNKEKEYETQREKDDRETQKAILIFDQLSEDEQEFYLDEISDSLKSGIEKARFKAERGTRKAHTQKPYALPLKAILKKHGLID